MKIADESLGQCEAHHWAFGRCHLIPHPDGTNHWIESRWTPGKGLSFTDAAIQGRVIICDDISPRAQAAAGGDGS